MGAEISSGKADSGTGTSQGIDRWMCCSPEKSQKADFRLHAVRSLYFFPFRTKFGSGDVYPMQGVNKVMCCMPETGRRLEYQDYAVIVPDELFLNCSIFLENNTSLLATIMTLFSFLSIGWCRHHCNIRAQRTLEN